MFIYSAAKQIDIVLINMSDSNLPFFVQAMSNRDLISCTWHRSWLCYLRCWKLQLSPAALLKEKLTVAASSCSSPF